MQLEISIIGDSLINPHKMILTKKNQNAFNNAIHCLICDDMLAGDKVHDH